MNYMFEQIEPTYVTTTKIMKLNILNTQEVSLWYVQSLTTH